MPDFERYHHVDCSNSVESKSISKIKSSFDRLDDEIEKLLELSNQLGNKLTSVLMQVPPHTNEKGLESGQGSDDSPLVIMLDRAISKIDSIEFVINSLLKRLQT